MNGNVISFTIDGNVQAQQRPRFRRIGKGVQTYDPKESAEYKKYVAKVAKEYAPEQLIESKILLFIDVYIKIPKSYTKKQREEILKNDNAHLKKPDVDNLAKGIKDGITGVIWKDDSLINELHIRKFYCSDEPRAEIKIEW